MPPGYFVFQSWKKSYRNLRPWCRWVVITPDNVHRSDVYVVITLDNVHRSDVYVVFSLHFVVIIIACWQFEHFVFFGIVRAYTASMKTCPISALMYRQPTRCWNESLTNCTLPGSCQTCSWRICQAGRCWESSCHCVRWFLIKKLKWHTCSCHLTASYWKSMVSAIHLLVVAQSVDCNCYKVPSSVSVIFSFNVLYLLVLIQSSQAFRLRRWRWAD